MRLRYPWNTAGRKVLDIGDKTRIGLAASPCFARLGRNARLKKAGMNPAFLFILFGLETGFDQLEFLDHLFTHLRADRCLPERIAGIAFKGTETVFLTDASITPPWE